MCYAKKGKKKVIRTMFIIMLTLIFSYLISFKFIQETEVPKILEEDIFKYSYIITFLFTTIGVLITLITFIYTMFDKLVVNIPEILRELKIEKNNEKKIIEGTIKESLSAITKELADNIKIILFLLIVVFAHFFGYYSKINSMLIYNDLPILVFIIEIYLLTILAIIDTVATLLKLLQYGLSNNIGMK